VLLALSGESAVPAAISSLLLELDVTLPQDRTSFVVDHFNYDTNSASEKHDVLLLPSSGFARKNVKNYFSVDGLVALPRAVGQVLGNTSPHLSPVSALPRLRTPTTPRRMRMVPRIPLLLASKSAL
jgi:oligosaccharyltransferase complex subunit beta